VLQLAQNPKTGAVELVEVPTPRVLPGFVLVRTLASVVSAGTERNTVRVGASSLLRTALSRPDLVDRVFNKFRKDGLTATWRAVKDRTERVTALGYSSSGRVVEVGEGVSGVKAGDLVACAGADFASHAEMVCVPRNLVAVAPPNLKPADAAFTTLGAIALQGVRLAEPQLGENVAVIGLGLLGQITVQLLLSAGCRVLAIDLDPERVEIARKSGAQLAMTAAQAGDSANPDLLPGGHGWDRVLITADSPNSEPIELAASLCREKGRVVLVGLVKTEIPRHEFYQKELEFVVSRSYGPGRYDPEYELDGRDYPYNYVRWTEGRNLEAFLDLLSRELVTVEHLITHRFPFSQASDAYRVLLSREPSLGIVFDYPDEPVAPTPEIYLPVKTKPIRVAQRLRVGVIGAGSFARNVLLPGLQRQGFSVAAVASGKGLTARAAAQKFGVPVVCSSIEDVLAHEDIESVVIATPHASHAELICQALAAGKHVFVEKPLAITREQVAEVRAAVEASSSVLMVGFNRRFSPFARRAREAIAQADIPFTFHYRVNAGPMPAEHWLNRPEHGGRIVGEVCHFIDLMSYLAGQPLRAVSASASDSTATDGAADAQISLSFEGGSHGVISYITRNRAPLSKERLEIWCGPQVIELEDFEEALFHRNGCTRSVRWRRQQKGHAEELAAFREAITRGGPAPISFDELARTTLATIEAVDCIRSGKAFRFDQE
jgi:polar amino acid transport system substrate-binding protein